MFEDVFTSLRAARAATFAYFALNGFVLGVWVVHIPAIEQQAGISHSTLGWLLLLLGGGAFLAMQVTGPLTDRFGARRVMPVSAVFLSAALVLPGYATTVWTLGGALLALGLANGCLDVSMNAHAVQVEAAYERPIMSAFHAMFSIGGVLAALLAARTLSWGWAPSTTLTLVAVIGVVTGLALTPGLLTPPSIRDDETSPTPARSRRRTPLRIWIFAVLAFMLMLNEGVANDWSALALRDVLDASPAVAALGYGAFSTAMTVGRLLVDRVAAAAGPVAVLRWGSVLAAVATALLVWSPSIPVVVAGWTLFGIGLSGVVPQLFSAAGHSDPTSAATNVSRVAGLGYLGMLAGPALIGGLTHVLPLNQTFVVPLLFCLVAAAGAPVLRAPATAGQDQDEPHRVSAR